MIVRLRGGGVGGVSGREDWGLAWYNRLDFIHQHSSHSSHSSPFSPSVLRAFRINFACFSASLFALVCISSTLDFLGTVFLGLLSSHSLCPLAALQKTPPRLFAPREHPSNRPTGQSLACGDQPRRSRAEGADGWGSGEVSVV